jgi:hypothetical protein
LTLTNLAGNLAAGDSFKLFYANSYSGAFIYLDPPMPASGLAWSTGTLASDGTLRVSAAPRPVIAHVNVSGGQLVFSGTNGIPHAPYYLLTSTNVALPAVQWRRVATNQFDSAGGFSITNVINPAVPQTFYSLQIP